MMAVYKSRFLTWGEVWFDNEPDKTPVDCIRYMQRPRPVPGARSNPFYTYVIDLRQSEQQLQANLKGDTPRKIRRAGEQDKIIRERCDPNDRSVMDHFERMFNEFAAMKHITPLQRPRLEGLAAAGMLDIFVARDPQGEILVFHVNCLDNKRVSGLYSTSLFRNLPDSAARNRVSRANCFLTWTDFLHYKEQGQKTYDFGGWHIQGTDPAMMSVNRFKTNFGGEVVCECQCEQILTLKGWLVLRAATLLKRAMSFRPRRTVRSVPEAPQVLNA